MNSISEFSESESSLMERFIANNGLLFLNSVFGGGAFSYLLNLKQRKTLLIVDTTTDCLEATLYLDGSEYRFIIEDLLDFILYHKIESLNINHLIWSKDLSGLLNQITSIKHKTKIKISVYIHDFYALCPSINLLNYKLNYCQLPSREDCAICLRNYPISGDAFPFSQKEVKDTRSIHNGDILAWRKLWQPLVDIADEIILPSKSASEIWLKVYDKSKSKVKIINHNLEYLKGIRSHTNQVQYPFLQVFVIGDIGAHKGGKIIDGLLELIKEHNFNICINVLGNHQNTIFENTPYLKVHGRFVHTEIAELLNNNHIDCFLMPSVCPETFSYTTQEMIATELPILSFDLGAQAEFISQYKRGTVIENISAKSMFQELRKIYEQHLLKAHPVLKEELSESVQQEISKLIDENSNLQFEAAENEIYRVNTLARLNDELVVTKNLLLQANDELNRVNNELSGVYSGQSWKITKPLRAIMKVFRKTNQLND